MCIDNIAAFFKCRMERVAIGSSKNARLLKIPRIDVIPMPLDHPKKGDILQSALPRSPQAVVYAGGFPIVLVLLIVVVELLRRGASFSKLSMRSSTRCAFQGIPSATTPAPGCPRLTVNRRMARFFSCPRSQRSFTKTKSCVNTIICRCPASSTRRVATCFRQRWSSEDTGSSKTRADLCTAVASSVGKPPEPRKFFRLR